MARFSGGFGGGSGIPGPQGPAGDSAYEVAVDNGFVGTEQEWLDSLGGGGVDSHGNFVFDNSTLSVDNETTYIKATDGGDDSVELMMDPYNGVAKISAKSGVQTPRFYASNPDWESATWTTIGEGQGQISFVNAPGIVNILSGELNTASNVGIYVNNMTIGSWNGASSSGFDVNIFVYGPNAENTTEASVDVFGFNYSFESKIEINNNENSMDITARDLTLNIRATEDRDINIIASDDATLRAEGDDLFLQAADDIRFTANYSDGEGEHFWRMDSEGEFHLPGNGLIWNPRNSSGDGYGGDTIHLVPNDTDNETEQRIIIDPTQPNHIHIRAGGVQDYSNVELILGGERAGVRVSDTNGTTVVQSKQEDYSWSYQNVGEGGNVYVVATAMAEPDYGDFTIINGQKYVISNVVRDEQNGTTSYETTPGIGFIPFENYTFIRDRGNHVWNFNRAGYLNGPTETGRLRVTGIMNDDGDIYVQSDQDVVIGGGESNGEFLNDPSNPNNQIATIGDINAGRFGASASFFSTTDQGPFAANAIQAFTFNDVDWANDIILIDMTKLTMINAGKYNIAFSAQLHQTNGSGIVNIWLNKNGTPVANSNTKVAITANNPYSVAAWNLFVDAAAEDYYELMWSSDSNNTVIEYEAATGSGATLHPAVPSIILTVNQVG